MADFDKAIAKVLRREGDYSNDRDDAGGETKYGISKRQYPDLDIASLTKAAATDIYDADYWRPLCGKNIRDQRLAEVMLDFAVTSGVTRSIKAMQIILKVPVDGVIGPITLGAMESEDADKLALQFTLSRIGFYAGLAIKKKSQRKFLPGWIARALDALYVN